MAGVAISILLEVQCAQCETYRIEHRNVLLTHKHSLRAPTIHNADIAAIGSLEMKTNAAVKIRVGKIGKENILALERTSQNPCMEFRRALKRAKLKRKAHGQRGAFLALQNSECSPNYEAKTTANPNDPDFADITKVWHLRGPTGARVPTAWNHGLRLGGSRSVFVGIIDTGIDYTHPDLAQNTWGHGAGAFKEIPNNGIDDDGNGYIDDIKGINAITNTGDPMDDHGHGTHVAGTIGAVGDNGVGTVGINWYSVMIGCKFLASNGSGSISNAIKCVQYFIDLKQNQNVPIVALNNSWGGGGYSAAMAAAIKQAGQAGILFVAAAGNAGTNIDQYDFYPACYTKNSDIDNIIVVGATNPYGKVASFSNYGWTVDLAAPGESIYSTWPGNQYQFLSGTSMVTGTIALMKATKRGLSPNQLKQALITSLQPWSALDWMINGNKYLNVGRAVA